MDIPVIPLDASVADIEEVLYEHKILVREWSTSYLKDGHFRAHVLRHHVRSLEDAYALCDRLDSEREGEYGCQKARTIRSWLTNPFWREDDRYLGAIAPNRRIMCSCHETGSFKKSP